MIKLIRLDRRHNGFLYWKYYADMPLRWGELDERAQTFHGWREWCWREWGASKELLEFNHDDLFDGNNSSNPYWCWLNKDGIKRIYLRDDAAASLFSLRWS